MDFVELYLIDNIETCENLPCDIKRVQVLAQSSYIRILINYIYSPVTTVIATNVLNTRSSHMILFKSIQTINVFELDELSKIKRFLQFIP